MPQYIETLDYLQTCLKVLGRYVESQSDAQIHIFWTVIAFLHCNTTEYHRLFVCALKVIAIFVTKPLFLRSLKKESRDGNLLALMFSVKGEDSAVINAVFATVASLLNQRLIELLGKGPSTVFLAIFALIPFYWNKFLTADKTQKCAAVLAELSELPVDMLYDIGMAGKRSPASIYRFGTLILGRFDDTAFQRSSVSRRKL
jgi:hypothetical protein